MKLHILGVLFVWAASSAFAEDTNLQQLSGILRRTTKAHSPYMLELDGATGSFHLRGDILNNVPEGTRIWVKGEIKTQLFVSRNAPSAWPTHWQVFMVIRECEKISKPFELPVRALPNPEQVGLESEGQVEIVGAREFKAQVKKALELLRGKAPEAYGVVVEYVKRIEQTQRSGMRANKEPPTLEMADRTTFYSLTWCAGSIAHEAYHAKLYHDYKREHPEGVSVPRQVWIGEDAERICIRHQVEVLKGIGAPKQEIAYCSALDGTHHDVNHDGKYTSEDYEKRDW